MRGDLFKSWAYNTFNARSEVCCDFVSDSIITIVHELARGY